MTNPTLTEKDVAEIASGLTKAQRDVVDTLSWLDWFAADDLGLGRPSTVGATCNSLVARGLLDRRSDSHVWGRSNYRATDLGARVRNHLISTPNMPKGDRA